MKFTEKSSIIHRESTHRDKSAMELDKFGRSHNRVAAVVERRSYNFAELALYMSPIQSSCIGDDEEKQENCYFC